MPSQNTTKHPRKPGPPRRSLSELFQERIEITPTCWLWTGSPHASGYGVLHSGRRHYLAHRLSYELHIGPIPHGLFVCHNCPDGDNPLCVNPKHLWLGTCLENTQDAVKKGRMPAGASHGMHTRPERRAYGERSGTAILTADEVREIRARYAGRNLRQQDLADEFGVSETTISHIVRRISWRHLD